MIQTRFGWFSLARVRLGWQRADARAAVGKQPAGAHRRHQVRCSAIQRRESVLQEGTERVLRELHAQRDRRGGR